MIPMLIPAVRQILFSQSLEKKVQAIVRRNGIAMYVPIPGVTCFQDSALTTKANVDDPVSGLKDYLGLYPATQTTSGYRPILRGKVKNFLTYSSDLTNSSWNKGTNISASDYRTLVNSDASATRRTIQQFSFVSGVIYTFSFDVTLISGNGNGGIGLDINGSNNQGITASATKTRFSITRTAASSVIGNVEIYLPAQSTWRVENMQLEVGVVANPYIPTTSAPASSSYGPYWLDFDGVDDVLSIQGLSAFTSAAVIKSVKNTGYSIQTEQDISAGYSFNTKFSNALMLAKNTPSSSELAVIKKYFDRLAGVA